MNRMLLIGITTFFALVGVSLLGEEKQALAGHGCYGCYGYHVRYADNGCYGCWGRIYPVRRLLFGPWCYVGYYRPIGYYGWRGCYGSSGCYGWYGGWNCYGGRRVVEPPATSPGKPTPEPPQPTPEPVPSSTGVSRDATLQVRVAPDAKVFVNDRLTTTPGSRRRYVSKGLEPGKTYRYELRAEAVRDGEKFSQTKVVALEAGQSVELAFDLDAARVAHASAP